MKSLSICLALILPLLLTLSPSADGQSLQPTDGSINLTSIPLATLSLSANPLPLPLLAQAVPIPATTPTINSSSNPANQTSPLLQQQQQQPNLAIPSNAYDRPLIVPVLVNSLLLRPLLTLNEQIAQSAAVLPQQLAQNGQVIGQALLVPIQQSTSTGNALLAGLNRTLLSLAVNGTLPPVEVIYPSLPALPSPSAVIGQMNAALNSASMSALNASTSVVGSGLNRFGASLASAGAGVQQLGDGVLNWAAMVDRMRQQLAVGNYNITFGDSSSPASDSPSNVLNTDGTPASSVLNSNTSSLSGNQSSEEVINASTPTFNPRL